MEVLCFEKSLGVEDALFCNCRDLPFVGGPEVEKDDFKEDAIGSIPVGLSPSFSIALVVSFNTRKTLAGDWLLSLRTAVARNGGIEILLESIILVRPGVAVSSSPAVVMSFRVD